MSEQNIFSDCKKLVHDPYWKGIFNDCSKGSFPKGMSFDETNHSIKVNNRSFQLPLDASESFEILMNIFKNDLGLISDKDIPFDPEEIKKIKEEKTLDKSSEWKKIKKNDKDQLLIEFCSEKKKEYRLNVRKAKELWSKIQTGFVFKQILPEDVIYKEGKITEITTLNISRTCISLTRKPKATFKQEKPVIQDKIQTLTEKYIKELVSSRNKN